MAVKIETVFSLADAVIELGTGRKGMVVSIGADEFGPLIECLFTRRVQGRRRQHKRENEIGFDMREIDDDSIPDSGDKSDDANSAGASDDNSSAREPTPAA
jgi:hypothetical protein